MTPSIIDAVSQANGSLNPVKNNALPGKFRYVKVGQPKKGNFSLKNILSKSGKKRKKNATADSPDADKPVKSKDDAWHVMNADDVSFPAAYLTTVGRCSTSDDDLSHYDMTSLDLSSARDADSKQDSKRSLLAKFKKILKPKSKVKKFKAEADDKADGGGLYRHSSQTAVRIQDGTDFMGALLPEEMIAKNGDGQLGGIKAQGSSNKQQQRPYFVRHMKQMRTRARETSRQSFINGQVVDDTGSTVESTQSSDSKPSNDALLAQVHCYIVLITLFANVRPPGYLCMQSYFHAGLMICIM